MELDKSAFKQYPVVCQKAKYWSDKYYQNYIISPAICFAFCNTSQCVEHACDIKIKYSNISNCCLN